jgi:hypothetical protein
MKFKIGEYLKIVLEVDANTQPLLGKITDTNSSINSGIPVAVCQIISGRTYFIPHNRKKWYPYNILSIERLSDEEAMQWKMEL